MHLFRKTNGQAPMMAIAMCLLVRGSAICGLAFTQELGVCVLDVLINRETVVSFSSVAPRASDVRTA